MIRKANSILFTRHEEKKALGRLIIKRKDNSKIGPTEVGMAMWTALISLTLEKDHELFGCIKADNFLTC